MASVAVTVMRAREEEEKAKKASPWGSRGGGKSVEDAARVIQGAWRGRQTRKAFSTELQAMELKRRGVMELGSIFIFLIVLVILTTLQRDVSLQHDGHRALSSMVASVETANEVTADSVETVTDLWEWVREFVSVHYNKQVQNQLPVVRVRVVSFPLSSLSSRSRRSPDWQLHRGNTILTECVCACAAGACVCFRVVRVRDWRTLSSNERFVRQTLLVYQMKPSLSSQEDKSVL
jgi:hypothetical protein